jgi:phage shock protein PspC (stress-responsive transcriptional regulator)
MERVVTINLNGNPYQLEEPAYDALRAYLSAAQAALADNPDKAEIIRDLEQAIADKCGGYLSHSKTVVSASEMTRILAEMGPVEGSSENAEAPRAESGPYEGPHRRLYRIKDRAVISGVCSGIGAYFDLDPNIVRLLFVLGALFTSGFLLIVYIVLMFAIPSAHTSQEWAAAHGVPFNAQEIIDRAKSEYGKFAEESSKSWRREQRAWRRSWRQQQRSWDDGWSGDTTGWDAPQSAAAPVQPVGYVERMFAGLFAFVFSVVTAALLIAFLIAFFSLVTDGDILGWTPPGDIPMWLTLVVLAIAYAAISAPFSALRRTSYATLSGRRVGGAGDGLVTLMLVALVAWFAWAYSSDARQFMEEAYVVIRDFVSYWTGNW